MLGSDAPEDNSKSVFAPRACVRREYQSGNHPPVPVASPGRAATGDRTGTMRKRDSRTKGVCRLEPAVSEVEHTGLPPIHITVKNGNITVEGVVGAIEDESSAGGSCMAVGRISGDAAESRGTGRECRCRSSEDRSNHNARDSVRMHVS